MRITIKFIDKERFETECEKLERLEFHYLIDMAFVNTITTHIISIDIGEGWFEIESPDHKHYFVDKEWVKYSRVEK